MSADEKRLIRELFHGEFGLSKKEAAELMIASAFLLGDGSELHANLDKVFKPSLDNFSEDQAVSAMDLIEKVGEVDPAANELKRELIGRIRSILKPRAETPPKWA